MAEVEGENTMPISALIDKIEKSIQGIAEEIEWEQRKSSSNDAL